MPNEFRGDSQKLGLTRNLLLNSAGIPLGPRFIGSFKEMRRVQWLNPDELFARSEKRLQSLLNPAADNVPFYRNFYRRLGLTSNQLRTVSDLQSLPIFTKTDYRQGETESFWATNKKTQFRVQSKTTGSTREPFHI
jgi:phenylacetate-CoA ligase